MEPTGQEAVDILELFDLDFLSDSDDRVKEEDASPVDEDMEIALEWLESLDSPEQQMPIIDSSATAQGPFTKPTIYHCRYCCKPHFSKVLCRKHERIHKSLLTCMFCQYRSRSYEFLKRHFRYHHVVLKKVTDFPSF